ncbi:MAG TPA: polysaccharide deacetylase family protein [Ignavibacteriaceae bacterium]|nr:polysaccharide deacetylase family protein [Ignavibacteriaceae bacterium]
MNNIFKIGKTLTSFTARRSNSKALILMYHSVDQKEIDPWGLFVTPKNFEEQLTKLQKHTNPVSLEEIVNGINENKIVHRSVAVTFDDGYFNNLSNAKPLLKKYNIPAAFFITAGKIGSEREYWWDELAFLLLYPKKLPSELCLKINNKNYCWPSNAWENVPENYNIKPWQSKKESRLGLYYSIWKVLKSLQEHVRENLINHISEWAGLPLNLRQSYRLLNEQELRELGNEKLFEIGSHSLSHPSLAGLKKYEQEKEIFESKEILSGIFKRPVISFAYPHGEYNSDTIKVLRAAGFKCSLTTEAKVVQSNKKNLFELPRLQVEDLDGKSFHKELEEYFMS